MPQIVYSKEEYDQMSIERDNLHARCEMLEKEVWYLRYAALTMAERVALDRVSMPELDNMGKLDAIKYVREKTDVTLLLAKNAVEGWIAIGRLIRTTDGRVHAQTQPRLMFRAAPRLSDLPEPAM